MDALKKQRSTRRALFTKSYNTFVAEFNGTGSRDGKLVAFQMLESKMMELDTIHDKYMEQLFSKEEDEDKITKEIEANDGYKKQFLSARLKVSALMTPVVNPQQPPLAIQPAAAQKTLKLPKIELPKFNGHIREWLPFWTQFNKIHSDVSISTEDKFQYLLQAIVAGSRASELVSSFPSTAENYDKAIKSLKNRFGRDDIVVEFYVRELLGLVLQNATKHDKKQLLSSIYDKLESYIRALESLGVTTDKCAAMLYPLVESSLPEEVLRAWQRNGVREVGERNGPEERNERLARLLRFLQQEVENEERIGMALAGFGAATDQEKSKKPKGKVDNVRDVPTANTLVTNNNIEKSVICIFCNLPHESRDCETARKLDLIQKREIVKSSNACFYCLKKSHMSRTCKIKIKCEWCSRRHVLLMCPGLVAKDCSENKSSDKEKIVKENNLTNFCDSPEVYLQTLKVWLYSQSKKKIVRVLIDSASQRSYIRSSVARELGYVAKGKQEIIHSLFGGVKSKCESHDVYLIHMKSIDRSYACNFSVMDQKTICDSIPGVKNDVWVKNLEQRNICLSDIGDENSPIDVLIGADVAGKLFTGSKCDLQNGLTAFETSLGWTVMGKLPGRSTRKNAAIMVNILFVQEASVTDLWRLDVIGITDPIEKIDKLIHEKNVQDLIMSTAQLTDDRFEVILPFKENHALLSSNYEISRNRLMKTIENLKNQGLFDAYDNVFQEWLSEEIIEVVSDAKIESSNHYLPHRPVIKAESTTKMRPIFDASACKKGCPSLNQCLEKGPNLIELVPSSLNRFREYEIGMVSDVKKAFLQIGIRKSDRDYLRFLWVKEGKLITFRHRRVVFGLACSPFLLAAVINLILMRALEKAKSDINAGWSVKTVEKLQDAFYVDNCVTSVETESERDEFEREARAIMATGSFDLRGWENTGDFTESETSLVLGLLWDKRKDVISINPTVLSIEVPEKVTKRSMLSAAHRVFDPIGFSSPVTLLPKLLLQELWSEKIEWDTVIEDKRGETFVSWLKNLELLKNVEIPRKIGKGNLAIHMFCDASGSAYAATVFARVEYFGVINVQLLNAKSRIAPKGATIPRLELIAATIGVRLADATVKSLTRKVDQITYWSDSSTVLAWIERDIQWGTFVYNRVKEIRTLSKIVDWKHVPGEQNPADLPSRGCTPAQLLESEWWFGPKWLYKQNAEWPVSRVKIDEEEIQRELKKTALVQMLNSEQEPSDLVSLFPSYTKLVRFLAWTLRFVENCRARYRSRKLPNGSQSTVSHISGERLLLKEMKIAETRLLQNLQNSMFDSKIENKLSSFKTIVNESGLIVMKTKILNREDNVHFLSPIVLDNKHEIVNLLIRETHEKLGHAGSLIVMSNLREKFWIISAKKAVRSVKAKCVICKKQNEKHMRCETPPPLPVNRVRDAAVFEITGVDFAGPLFLRGGEKAWIVIFTCAVYRAIHLELASSLSTDEFIDCFRRFIARRGRPRCMHSDNGTNFKGTANALGKLDWEKIAKRSSALEIEWVFNPPSAPWWGGWWERLIGVLKSILRKVLGRASLTYEHMMTTLCDSEAIVNSRPLTYISEDPDDLKPLTPSMFLQEIREVGVPDLDMLCNAKLNKKLRYRQKIFNDLRSRFRTEYLGQLVLKNSKKETREIKIGDVVLIGDDSSKRIDWPLALVVEAIKGRDGEKRLFVLKTKKGIVKRPIQRIYPLEVSCSDVEIVNDFQKKRKERLRPDVFVNENDELVMNDPAQSECENNNVTTRSGRVSKKPKRF